MKSDEITQEWKDVPGLEDLYEISRTGLCRSKQTKIILAVTINSNGYPVYSSTYRGTSIRFYIHRAIAELWVENPDNKPEVNHKDGNKLNFEENNLEWVTRSENIKHAIELGLRKTKLTREIVNYCRKVYVPYHKQFSAAALSRTFGVTKLTMQKAITGETWK